MKDKKLKALAAVILILFVGLIYLKMTEKEEVDWTPTFVNTDTNPYGTYISYQLLEDVFDKKNIRTTRKPIYSNLKEDLEYYFSYQDSNYVYDGPTENDPEWIDEEEIIADEGIYDPMSVYDGKEIFDTTTYIFINQKFELDKVDLEYLLDFVGLGNNVFISAENFSHLLMDTLGIKNEKTFLDSDSTYTLVDYPNKKYNFSNIYNATKFNIDSCRFAVRTLATNSKNDTTFIRVKYGQGYFYFHSIPVAFTNINLLNTDKYDFAFRSLSYIPRNNIIIWDEYQKQGDLNERSMLRVMLSSLPLRIALYIILLGLLLFMIFRAKRIQRIIPIIKPPVNSSLEFLGTISNLYYRKKDFETIAEKRQAFFLDYIRKNYYMSTEHIDNEFIHILSAKSGVEKDKLIELFALYKEIIGRYIVSNDVFLKYNSLLEDFYRSVKNK